MYDHVLVPTDGSEQSKRAAVEAARLAESHDARVTLLTAVQVVSTASPDTVSVDDVEEALIEAERRKGDGRIDETVSAVESVSVDESVPVDVETEVVSGTPHRAVHNYVESTDVDLVVSGASGHDALSGYTLGSTTERVIQLCDVPVVVV